MFVRHIRHIYPNELYHHGIKGQKWGVRRYQNPDGSLTPAGRKRYLKIMNKAVRNPKKLDRVAMGLTQQRTIPAGTTMYRTSAIKNEQKKAGESVYVTYLQPERNLYKGGWIRSLAGTDEAYEKTYRLTKDLSVPSRSTCENEIKNLMKDPKLRHEVFEGYLDFAFPKNSPLRAEEISRTVSEDIYKNENAYSKAEKKWLLLKGKQMANNFKTMPIDEAAYNVQLSLGLAPKTKAKLIENLKKQGYNAMVDEASVGGRFGHAREGVDPLIIFDASDLTPIKEEPIRENDERKSRSRYHSYRNKMKNSTAKWSEF